MRSSFITRVSLVVFFLSLASLTLTAQDRVYVPYTQTDGVSPTPLALSASNNDFVISYVTPASSRKRASKPSSVCGTAETPVSELKVIVPYDTTFLAKFNTSADRDAFISARIAENNATIRKTEPGGNRRVSLAFSWLVPYTSHGVSEDDFRWETTSPEILAMKKSFNNAVVVFWVGERGDFAGTASGPGNGDSSLAFEVMSYDGAPQGIASDLFGVTLGMHLQVEIESPAVQPAWSHEYSTQSFYTASASPSICLPSCRRVDVWSSPFILVDGEPAGKVGVSEDGNKVLSSGFQMLGAQTVCVATSSLLGQIAR